MVKKTLFWLVIAFAVFYLISQPSGAAGAIKGAATGVEAAFNSIITFFSSLFG
jgi:hypothetical protein